MTKIRGEPEWYEWEIWVRKHPEALIDPVAISPEFVKALARAVPWDEVEAFDPNQPRDEKGRWRDVGVGRRNALGYSPVPCGGDLDKACRLIAEGRAVELEQPDEARKRRSMTCAKSRSRGPTCSATSRRGSRGPRCPN